MSRVVVSFTSSPYRLPLFLPVLSECIKSDLPVAAWQLHIPEHYRDQTPYPPELLDALPAGLDLIQHPGPDLGPALKLMGALRTESDPQCKIITIDDDVGYPPQWIRTLIETSVSSPDHAVGGKGSNWANGRLHPVREHGASCDMLQGYGGVIYPRGACDEAQLTAQLANAPDALRFSDDLLLSNHLAARHTVRTMAQPKAARLAHLSWGDTDPDALTLKEGGNHKRYAQAAEHLRATGEWALN